MSETIFRNRYETGRGEVYYFVTSGREPSYEEVEEFFVKYFDEHKKRVMPGKALQVDLRPAFSVPLGEITDVKFLSVPRD
jgi:hypothetical protein